MGSERGIGGILNNVRGITGGALLALLLSCALGTSASTAKPAHRCSKGKLAITVNHRKGCLPRKTLQPSHAPRTILGLSQAIAAASERPAFLRKLFGPRFSPLILSTSAVRRAVSRQMLTSVFHAAKLAAAPTTNTTQTTTTVPAPDGIIGGTNITNSSSDSVTGGLPTHNDGVARVTDRLNPCPAAGGVLHGTVGNSVSHTMTAGPYSSARLRTIATLSMDFSARVTGHVNQDAQMVDYDAVIDYEVSMAARTVGPAGLLHGTPTNTTEHVRLVLLGIKPGQSPIAPVGAEHVGMVSWTQNGNRIPLVQGSGDGVRIDKTLSAMVAFSLFSIGRQADAMFAGAESLFAHGFCLKAHFSPEIAPTGRQTIAVDVTDRENKPVRITLSSSANGGTVSPKSADASPGHPARFVFTPDSKTGPVYLGVTGRSNRGTVSGSTTTQRSGAPAYAYDVVLQGSGHYTETDAFSSSGGSHSQTYSEPPSFGFTSHWPLTVIPADGKPPTQSAFYAQAATISGSVESSGSESGGSTYTCHGQLAPPSNPAQNQITIGSPAASGAVPVAINGFAGLYADSGSGSCTHSGPFWSSPTLEAGGIGLNDLSPATVGQVSLSKAQLQQPSFTVPLTGSLSGACTAPGSNTYGNTCTQDLGWTASATFTRKGTCTRGVNGYSCNLGSGAGDRSGAKLSTEGNQG